MAPWEGPREKSWASNGNIAVYIFAALFVAWLGFQIWAGLGGPPPPVGLDPMVMAALGVAITTKSVERRTQDDELRRDVDKLKEAQREEKRPTGAGED